jgi:hypothetical protein
MTSSQFLIIIGTIYIAPHINKYCCLAMGCVFLIIAAIRELGLI